MTNDIDLGNGYEYQINRGDNLHIRRKGKVVIDSTIVDLTKSKPYVIGLRLPAEHLQCNGGYKIRLKKTKHYFILNTHDHRLDQYTSYDDFIIRLDELGLTESVKLDYSAFYNTWQTYSKYYENINFANCEPIIHQ